jgi:tape measure domain-containing protein
MADASFTIKLADKVSGPARAAGKGVQTLHKSISRLKAGLPAVRSGFEKNRGAMSDWRTQATRAAQATNRLAKAQKRAAQADPLHGLGGKTGAMGGQFGVGSSAGVMGALGVAAAGAAVAVGMLVKKVVEFGIRAGVAFGKAVVGMAAFAEDATLAFDLLTGSKGKGAATLKEVTALSVELGIPLKQTVKDYQKLLAMQFTPKAAKDVIRMAADLQAIGVEADKVSSIIMTMTQIKAKGKLSSEELLQLAEAGVSTDLVFKALEKSTGKTKKEILKLIQAGKITADQGLEAIQQAVLAKTKTSKLGEAAAKAGTTMTGMWNSIKAAAMGALMGIATDALPDIAAALKPIMADVLSWMKSPQAKKFFDAIVAGARSVAKHITKVWNLLGKMSTAFSEGFGEGFDSVAKGMKGIDEIKLEPGDMQAAADGLIALAKALGMIAGAAEAAGRAWKKLPDFGASGFGMGGSAPGVEGIKYDTDQATFDLFGVGGLGDQGEYTAGLKAKGQEAGKGLSSGMADGIKGGLSSVVQAATDVATSAITAAKNALGIASPSKVFMGLGKQVAMGMEEGIVAGTPAVSAAASGIVNPAAGTGGGTTQNISAPAKINMTIQGSDDPQATAAAVAATLEAKISGMFESAALQVGVIAGG